MNNVILITGAGRGIGKATALRAAKKNYFVGVNYLNNKMAAQKTVEEIKSDGGKAILVKGDVGIKSDVDMIFDTLKNKFGTVTSLVANAGDTPKREPFFKSSIESLERTIQVNLMGSIYCVRKFTNDLLESKKRGSIVLISSEAARFGGNQISTYAASKAGVNAFVVGAAREVGPYNIRINAVSPGTIYTEALASEGKEKLTAIENSIPLGRIGDPLEAAQTILWLLSDEASYVSGSMVTVSGGR